MNLSNENVIHIQKENTEFLQFSELVKFENLVHAFSLKPLNFRNKAGVESEYEKFLKVLEINPQNLVKPTQRHTANVICLEHKQNQDKMDINLEYLDGVDGVITNQKNIALATTSADCICIIFYDPIKKIIGNVHSGWRGTFQKIATIAVSKMISTYNCNPANILAFMMPGIRKCHFEVDEDVKIECEKIFDYTGKLNEIIEVGRIIDGVQKYNIDCFLINKILLENSGILRENIYDSKICSFCSGEKINSRRFDGENFALGTTIVMMK